MDDRKTAQVIGYGIITEYANYGALAKWNYGLQSALKNIIVVLQVLALYT
jgi:hypothetical protein